MAMNIFNIVGGVVSNNLGFFSDPKVAISLLALVVSMVALVWTLANQWDQNRRWDAINAPNIVLREPKMLPWEKISSSQVKSRNWGYEPEIFSGELKDEFLLLSAIKLRTEKGDQPIDAARLVSTVEEAEIEARRIGLASQASIAKTLRPFFQFENIGKTTAYKANITVDVMEVVGAKKEWRRAFEANSSPNVGPGQQTSVYFDIGLPGDAKIEVLSFRINVKFNGKGVDMSSEIDISWDGKHNYWHYSSSESRGELR